MSVEWQNVPIHFGKGVDTKTDSKLVVPGKILRLQDAVFTQVNQCDKRNGYQPITSAIVGGGNLSAPKMVKAFKDELVCTDSGVLYSYSSTQAAWVNKGSYLPVAVTKQVVSRAGSVSHEGSCGAASGNIAIFAWYVSGVPTATVMDLSTNTALISDFALASANGGSCEIQCLLMGSGDLAVFYVNASNHLAMRKLTHSGATVSFAAEVQLNTDTLATAYSGVSMCATATGAAILYPSSTTTYKLILINSSGTTTASTTVAVSAHTYYISSINRDSVNGNFWLYFTDLTGGQTKLKYSVLDSSLSVVLASTLIATTDTSVAVSAVRVSTTAQTVVYSTALYAPSNSYVNAAVYSASVTSAGVVGSIGLISMGPNLYSEPFALGSDYYVAANNYSVESQANLFYVRVSDGLVIGKSISGVANDFRCLNNIASNPLSANAYNSSVFQLVKPIVLSASKVIIPCGETYEEYTTTGGSTINYILGCSYAMVDASNTELNQSFVANNSLVLNGGILKAYDGTSATELGFSLFPEVTAYGLAASPGIANGTYEYFFVYRWVDSQGNIYDSAPSVGLSVTYTAPNSTGSLYIPTLGLTDKKSPSRGAIEIRVYRTTVAGAATTARWVGSVTNDPTVASVTFTDNNADSATVAGELLYTDGGTLENIAPPPSLALTLHNNRLWAVDSENPNSIWYTKTFLPGAGINFSDLLQVQVDAVGGNCVALAGMDDKLVIFEENAPLVMAGDGANDTGTGSTLTSPQPIPSDVGCSQSKGVITFPMGVLFKSPKGIYLLDRALGVKYLGMEVEAYNSQNVTAATMLATKSQIRLLTDSGYTLVYDYIFNQWSTFTNHAGYSADIWQDTYVYARTDGAIYQESSGYYLDNSTAIAPLIQTAWLSLASVQGFQRLRRFELLGSFANGASASHGVQVSAAYDFGTSFSTPIQYLFGAAAATGVFQYRERLPRQKCDAISLLIQEVTTGNSSESVSFTDMSFEAGIKRGLNKLAQTNTVG